jgi:hypothetical protein
MKKGRKGEREKGSKFFVKNLERLNSKFKIINEKPISPSPLLPFSPSFFPR